MKKIIKCNCLTTLKEGTEFKFKHSQTFLYVTAKKGDKNSIIKKYYVPMEIEGKKGTTMLEILHCPFCGKKL